MTPTDNANLAAAALEGLTLEQRRVVTARDSTILCIAGAGSGKTTTLTHRVAHMIASGIAPASILVLTFTRAAAEHMIERAHKLHPDAVHVEGGTFHSFAARTLSQYAHVLGRKGKPTIIDGDDVNEVIRIVAADLPRVDGNYPNADTIRKCLSFAANTKLQIADVLARRHPLWVKRSAYVEEIASLLAAYKATSNVADYDDLLILATVCLRDATVGPLIRARHRYILVDEHQDSNALQLELIQALAGDGTHVMVVGDPAQAIYGFRGAAPNTLMEFPKQFAGAQVLKLESNFRSSAPILAAANAVDRAMSPRFDRVLKAAGNAATERPRLVTVNDMHDEARRLTGTVLAAVQAGGAFGQHAVLVRSLRIARHIETEFLAWKVPYVVKGGIRLVEAAHVKDLLAVARIVTNVTFGPAWLRLLQHAPKVGPKTANDIAYRAMGAGHPILAARELQNIAEKSAPILVSLAEAIREMASTDPLPQGLNNALAALDPLMAHAYGDEWHDRRRDLDLILELATRYDDLREFLADLALDLNVARAHAPNTGPTPDDAVTISTIHSAKGLEWDHVHIPGFVASNYPSRMAEREDDQAEELRCFYVAITRAKSQLTFYRPLTMPNTGVQDDSAFWPTLRSYVDAPATPSVKS